MVLNRSTEQTTIALTCLGHYARGQTQPISELAMPTVPARRIPCRRAQTPHPFGKIRNGHMSPV
jgi:hypothetical protein